MNCQQKVEFHPGTASARESSTSWLAEACKGQGQRDSSAKSRARAMTVKDEVIFIPIAAPREAPCGADNVIYCWRNATT